MLTPFLLLFFLPFFLVSLNMGFVVSLLFTFNNTLFILTVFMICMSVIKWSSYYMKTDQNLSLFLSVTASFVYSMVLFILSNDCISLLMGFDLLGITSFLLIMYYKNQKVINSALITIMMNKMGDFFLIWASLSMILTNPWSSSMSSFLLLLAMMVKSAQLPFSSWLPIAMAAPTPISALVHSSTLVTAGVYLLMKYNMQYYHNTLLLVVSTTLLVSSFQATIDPDMKKVVALSTMSQMSFILLTLSFSLNSLAFMHLLTHAFFKSLMFISMGNLIHQSFSSQHSNILKTTTMSSIFLLQTSAMALMGLGFTSGFMSKDLILEKLETMNKTNMFLIVALIGMTFIYTARFLSPLYNPFSLKEKGTPPFFLFLFSLMLGFLLFVTETTETSKNISMSYQFLSIFILSSVLTKPKSVNTFLNNSYKVTHLLINNFDLIMKNIFWKNSSYFFFIPFFNMKQNTLITSALVISSIFIFL